MLQHWHTSYPRSGEIACSRAGFERICLTRPAKDGGRLAVSDVVATTPFPDEVQQDLALHAGCVAGASLIDHLEGMLTAAGFVDVRIQPKDESRTFIREWVPGTNIAEYLISATIEACKPAYA